MRSFHRTIECDLDLLMLLVKVYLIVALQIKPDYFFFSLIHQALYDTNNALLPYLTLCNLQQSVMALHADGELLGHHFGLGKFLFGLELFCGLLGFVYGGVDKSRESFDVRCE